jgi:hypothetical protein
LYQPATPWTSPQRGPCEEMIGANDAWGIAPLFK